MIARSLSHARPIPFLDPLHEPQGLPTRAVRWSPPPPASPSPQGMTSTSWMPRPLEGQRSTPANDHGGKAAQPAGEARTAAPGGTTPRGGGPTTPRRATARYDGPHSLSVRSSATGRHYRFPQQGAIQVIDAADISLMRRIEDVTIL